MDLADPSPALGWAGRERRSLAQRSNADVLLALALVHHLAIGRNVPLAMISSSFADLAPALVIEWVPKQDAMVQHLLASREDVFPDYDEPGFRAAFSLDWDIFDAVPIEHSERVIFRMRSRSAPGASGGGEASRRSTAGRMPPCR